MYVQEQEELDFRVASISEVAAYQAAVDGEFQPEVEWILSSWDSWERNPYYTGKPGPHPEEEEYFTPEEEAAREAFYGPVVDE